MTGIIQYLRLYVSVKHLKGHLHLMGQNPRQSGMLSRIYHMRVMSHVTLGMSQGRHGILPLAVVISTAVNLIYVMNVGSYP